MKVPQSVRVLHQDLLLVHGRLKAEADSLILARKPPRWHYESRLKGEESFALKLETGRVKDPKAPEDLFASTLVVENHSRIAEAEKLILEMFKLHQRKPPDPGETHLAPHSFDYDDLRLYVKWEDDPKQRPTGLDGLLFEVQIKTFLQHAWGIATHDFIYKSDDVDWPASRIAYQVKAMLENAELSISEAKKLTGSALLQRSDMQTRDQRRVIADIASRWPASQLPADVRRLAQNLSEMRRLLRLEWHEIWEMVDDATVAGEGTKTLNLSPYGAILAALIRGRGAALFTPLNHPKNRASLFVSLEIDLPPLTPAIMAKIIRPPIPEASLAGMARDAS